MLGLLFAQPGPPAGVGRMNAGDLDMRIQGIVVLLQTPVCAAAHDDLVQLGIIPLVSLPVVLGDNRFAQRTHKLFQSPQFLRTDVPDAQLSRQALQRAAKLKGLFHVLRGQAGDERAAARADLHQALGGKLLQRAPHGGKADSELAGKPLHIQPLAWFDVVTHNRLPKRLVDLVRRSLPLELGKFHPDFPMYLP